MVFGHLLFRIIITNLSLGFSFFFEDEVKSGKAIPKLSSENQENISGNIPSPSTTDMGAKPLNTTASDQVDSQTLASS